MANVIKLGKTPEFFKEIEVAIGLPDGEEGKIPVTFKYRTQDDYWEYRDAFFKSLGAAPASTDASLPAIAKQARRRTAEYIIGAIGSWGLDIELTVENLSQMFNEIASSSSAIADAYQAACLQGRLGN